MPQIAMHRKAKKATVLAKRTQYLRKYYKERLCKPLYEKLRNNNNHLAKALSQEKEHSQSLFSQNIALLAEVQELRLACNTRDNIISNVLNNAKEILKMLVTMSGYVTNTISTCQEFAASNTNLRLSSISAGKEASRRLSTKSPAKGVVKPMVSGHTITKPTINLSRVNINNTPRLSDIQEVPTPTRNQEMNETRSSIAVSIPITQLRYGNVRTCRMPERLAITSPRINDDEQRIRRKRSHHSKRISGSYSRSRSNRWSNETIRNSIGYQLGSPRVKLNDVSKLLQNSQSINIRTLIDNRISDIEVQEGNDDTSHDTSDRNVVISETQVSIKSDEENETVNRETTDWEEDPLEGPSWLFNNTLNIQSQNNESQSNHLGISHNNNNRISQRSSKIIPYNDESSDTEDMEEELSSLPNINKCITDTETAKTDLSSDIDRVEEDSCNEDNSFREDSFCAVLTTTATSSNTRNNGTTNFSQFVTLRRDHSDIIEEETEDFTLMLRQPTRNMNFDINELRLPVLEESMINPTIPSETDTEMTRTIQRITNIQLPSVSDERNEESMIDLTTLRLPLIPDNIHDRMSSLENNKYSNKKKGKMNKNKSNMKDPSAAKVVLEKLNESHVKPRSPSPDDTKYINDHAKNTVAISNIKDNFQDWENSSRPRRRKAPVNLKEPKLNKKLRRDW